MDLRGFSRTEIETEILDYFEADPSDRMESG